MNAAQFSHALGKVNDKYIMEAITYERKKKSGWLKWGAVAACLCLVAGIAVTGILRSHLLSPNDVLHEPEQYRAIMWEDVPSTEPFGSLFPTEIIEGYVLENDVALYGEGNESVLQARFFNEQLGDELVVTVYVKGHYGDEPLDEVIYGGHAFKGSMIAIDGGDYVIRYLTKRDIIAISGFEDMVKSARQLSSWSMA